MSLNTDDQSSLLNKTRGFDARSEPTTLIAAFSDHLQARNALARLMQAGYVASEAWLVENSAQADLSSELGNRRSTTPEGATKHGFTAFIDRMFGFDDETPALEASKRQVSTESQSYVSRAYESKQHLLVVSATPVRIEEARTILVAEGAVIDDQANEYLARDFQETLTMRLSEEELVAHKEQIAAGEVTLRKEIVTEMRTIEVPVSHEEVIIERRILDGREQPLAGEHISATADQPESISVQLMEERVTVEKKLVPKEEITLSKRQVHDTKTVSEEVRREEAKVERSTAALRGRDGKKIEPEHSAPA